MWRNFTPSWEVIGALSGRSDTELEQEPMLFGADVDFAFAYGGPITQEFLSRLPMRTGWLIDSRVHMLKSGWYPAIPGWHIDSIPRSKTNRQPDFSIDCSSLECVMAVVGNQTQCLTEFLRPGTGLDLWCPDGKRWSDFSREINSSIRDGEVEPMSVPLCGVVKFGPKDFHRAVAATGDCWRMFIRACRGHSTPPTNKIRRQTQVYLHELEAGW